MRYKGFRPAIAALLLIAGTAALAAEQTTIVGTIEGRTGNTLEVKTDSGLQYFVTEGTGIDPTLGKGDVVRVSYTRQHGALMAKAVARVATVQVTLPPQGGEETLIVDAVETGSLSSLAGKGNIQAKVMMAGNNQVTIRTADDKAPVVAFRSHVPKGITDFRTDEDIVLRVPPAVVPDNMTIHTAPVYPEPATRHRSGSTGAPTAAAAAEPQPEPEPAPVATAPADAADEDGMLPETASSLHVVGLVGLTAVSAGLGLGVSRRLW